MKYYGETDKRLLWTFAIQRLDDSAKAIGARSIFIRHFRLFLTLADSIG